MILSWLEQAAESSDSLMETTKQREQTGNHVKLLTSNQIPSYVLLPARLYYPILPKQHHQLRTKCSNTAANGGISYPNHQRYQHTDNSAWQNITILLLTQSKLIYSPTFHGSNIPQKIKYKFPWTHKASSLLWAFCKITTTITTKVTYI